MAPGDLADFAPSEIQQLHYDYLNSAQYEEAYEFFAAESKNTVPLGVYSSAYAPTYEVSEYTVNSERINGGTATIEADLVVSGTQNGTQQYPITQEFVREDGQWRLIMRDNQQEGLRLCITHLSLPYRETMGSLPKNYPIFQLNLPAQVIGGNRGLARRRRSRTLHSFHSGRSPHRLRIKCITSSGVGPGLEQRS